MSSKTRYMIAAGASVGIIRAGKRVTIQAGGGDDFTEDEITRINAAIPGALRAPVNESRRQAVSVEDEDAGDDEAAAETKAAPKAKGAPKAKAAAKPKPAAKDDEDAEDEDI